MESFCLMCNAESTDAFDYPRDETHISCPPWGGRWRREFSHVALVPISKAGPAQFWRQRSAVVGETKGSHLYRRRILEQPCSA